MTPTRFSLLVFAILLAAVFRGEGVVTAGSPFALARLSALYYLGEGGVRQDYDMALKLKILSPISTRQPSFR